MKQNKFREWTKKERKLNVIRVGQGSNIQIYYCSYISFNIGFITQRPNGNQNKP